MSEVSLYQCRVPVTISLWWQAAAANESPEDPTIVRSLLQGRGASLIETCLPLGLYSRPMPMALRWS